MPLFLLYFIILTNLYCAKTLNIVLSFVIDVHFVMVLLLVFSQMWQFPYSFGFCNPVWIYGRKISDDEINQPSNNSKHIVYCVLITGRGDDTRKDPSPNY
jgi:hypothetical protein